jgi:hypothetical protein
VTVADLRHMFHSPDSVQLPKGKAQKCTKPTSKSVQMNQDAKRD